MPMILRRRWPTFSLRTLFVVVTIAALLAAIGQAIPAIAIVLAVVLAFAAEDCSFDLA